MASPVNLFDQRRPELEELLAKHLEAGSLDEASATVFDGIIDGWHREALSQLEAEQARTTADSAARLTAAEEALRVIDERLARLREQRDRIDLRLHEAEAHLVDNGIDPGGVPPAPRPASAAPPSPRGARVELAGDPPEEGRRPPTGGDDDLPDAA